MIAGLEWYLDMTTNELKMKKIQDYLEFDLSLIERVPTKRALIEHLVESHFDSMALSNPMEEKFIQAVLKLDLEKVEYYLQQGIDPNIKTLRTVYGEGHDDAGVVLERTPLDLVKENIYVTWGRDERAAKLLEQYGAERLYGEVYEEEDCPILAELDKNDLGEKLIQACHALDVDAVKTLLQEGADPNYLHVGPYPDNRGCFNHETPIILTANRYGSSTPKVEIVKLLFQYGADAKAVKNSFILESQIQFREIKMIQALIENGIDLIEIDEYGNTVLHYLMRHPIYHGVDIIDLMVLNGADIHAKNVFGFTPLHAAVQTKMMRASYSNDSNLDMITHLVKLGANMYEPDNQGYSALFWSLHSPDIQEALFEGEIANYIYGLPDDNHLEDKFIQSCFDRDIIKMADLIEKGVDIDFSTLRQTESYSKPSDASRNCLDITIEQTYGEMDSIDLFSLYLLLHHNASLDHVGKALESIRYNGFYNGGGLGTILLSYGADPIESGLKDILKVDDEWLSRLLDNDCGKEILETATAPLFEKYMDYYQQPDAIPLMFLPEDFFA
jgi:ankyrin repeat protein